MAMLQDSEAIFLGIYINKLSKNKLYCYTLALLI